MPPNLQQSQQIASLVQTLEGLTKALSDNNLPQRISEAEDDIQACRAEQTALRQVVQNLQGAAEEIQRSVDELMALKNKGAGIAYAIGVVWTIAAIFLGAIASNHWSK